MGEKIVFWSASLLIVAVVALMCRQCLAELGWLPGTAPAERPPAPAAHLPPCACAFWFLAALATQWLVLFAAHCAVHGGPAGFGAALWSRFTTAGDSPHYLYLAENGYTTDPEKINLIVFYPLYPMLMRLLGPLFGGSLALAGMVLSQLCFGAAAVLFRRLCGCLLPLSGARAATTAFLLYPFSFFSFGVYTEGLFLLLSIGCLYALERQRWGIAGLLSFLAALCRTQGLALLFACIFAWLLAPAARRRRAGALALPGALAGYGCYLALNKLVTGSWTAYLYYQSIAPWYQSVGWFGGNLAQQLGMAKAYPGLAWFIYIPQIVLYYVGAAALLWLFWRRRALVPAVYATAYFGMSYLCGWLISGSRYMFGCLGLYLALGSLPSRRLRRLLLALEGLLFLRYAIYYMQGQAIM